MKFIKFDYFTERYCINLDRLSAYAYHDHDGDRTLILHIASEPPLRFQGDRAADLVKLLDEAIDGDNITDTVANAAASALLASLLDEKAEVAIDA